MRAISRSMTALLIAAAASTAVLSHYVIDVVADYLVPHASFDDVASHGSRGAIGAIAVAAAFVLALRGLRLCCDAAAGRGSLSIARPSWWIALPFIAGTVVLACVAVPAMEVADARWGGAAIDGLDDAFGGSTLLGVVTTAICGVFVAGLLFVFVRWLLSHRDRIVAAIASEIRRAYACLPNPQLLRRLRSVAATAPRIVAFRRGKRAPPRDALETYALSLKHHEETHATLAHCGVLPHHGPRAHAHRRSNYQRSRAGRRTVELANYHGRARRLFRYGSARPL